jgi:hypothetical protein
MACSAGAAAGAAAAVANERGVVIVSVVRRTFRPLTTRWCHLFCLGGVFLSCQSRSQRQLDITQARHIVLYDDGIIIQQVQVNFRAQRRALGEQNQILEEELALEDICTAGNLCETILPLGENCLLLGIVALATECELLRGRTNIYHLTQPMHVTDNLLEIDGRHGDDTRELHRWDIDGLDIELNQVQREVRDHLLLAIQNLYTELRSIRLLHKEHDTLTIRHGLHELEEVNHVHTDDVLLRAVELIETVGLQTQMHQNRMSAIHGHDFNTRAVDFDVCICQNILNSFNQCAKGGGLDSADAEEVLRVIHSTCCRGSSRLSLGADPHLRSRRLD